MERPNQITNSFKILKLRYHISSNGIFFILIICFFLGSFKSSQAAIFNVDTTTDELDGSCVDGDCSLRDAIALANASSNADVINIPAGTYTLSITGNGEDSNSTGDLDITEDLTITGAGIGLTIIDGNATDRVFHVDNGASVTIEQMTIQNGNAQIAEEDGGGIVVLSTSTLTINSCDIINNSCDDNGAGISSNTSDVIINSSKIDGNTAGDSGGGIFSYNSDLTVNTCIINGNVCNSDRGGGIYALISGGDATSSFDIVNSTVSNNSSLSNNGGGILVLGLTVGRTITATITNCTISGNSSWRQGGGLNFHSTSFGTTNATVSYCTVTGNTGGNPGSSLGGGGIFVHGSGGTTNVTLKNSIIIGNTDNSTTNKNDCVDHDVTGVFNSGGYNIIGSNGDTQGCIFDNGNQTGDTTPSGAAATVLNNNLDYNGGTTKTHLLVSGSDALDIIPNGTNDCGGSVTADQRGVTRPSNSNCDAGAVEGIINLPVDLIFFSSTYKEKESDILLSWATATEMDNLGFEVQWTQNHNENRLQSNFKNWETLEFIEGAGNSFDKQTYSYLHKSPRTGINYYRLKQIDFDGSFKYSTISR